MVTCQDKNVKPLFSEMKNKIAVMAAQVKELARERDSWKIKFLIKIKNMKIQKRNWRKFKRIIRN